MKIHPIQTGTCQIKRRFQVATHTKRTARVLDTMLDRQWTAVLPTLCWLIEHPTGLILVDTGETAQAHQPDYYPRLNRLFMQQSARIFINEEEEVGPQIETLGFRLSDVRQVILTHLHQDHIGGLRYFPHAEFLVSRREYEAATGPRANLSGYWPSKWPARFQPTQIDFQKRPFLSFSHHHTLPTSKDIHLIPTPGHSQGHLSVIVAADDMTYFLAGDTSFNQNLMLTGAADGVAADAQTMLATQQTIRRFVQQQPTVYLPSHDPASVMRLQQRQTAVSTPPLTAAHRPVMEVIA